jgi:hypothetical protein
MPGEEMMMDRSMEMEVMDDVSPERLMDMAKEVDDAEMSAIPKIEGDFSLQRINGVVAALNRVNRMFQAPPYPDFESAPQVLPPEFVKNLLMVDAAVDASGMDEYSLKLEEIADDDGMKMIQGRLDAMASDKSFKAFLNKPLGMGEFQKEAGVPQKGEDLGRGAAAPQPPAEGGDAEVDLFMSRMG